MKELDLLLQSWLQHCFDQASATERLRFEALLLLPDPELAALLLGADRAQYPELASAVDMVLTNARIMLSRSDAEPSRIARV